MGDPVTTDELDDAEVLAQPGTETGGAIAARALTDGSNLSVVPAGATDVPARNLLDALGDLRSLKTYCKGDGTSDDQAGLVSAFTAASTNGWELSGANGIYVSTDTIPNFLDIKVSGRGAINRNGAIFHFNPLPGQRNTLYASPAGGGDGLSAAQPCRFAEALNALLVRGPVLSGLWRIRLAAGRYSPVSLDSRVRSVYPVEIQGPDVGGWPNEPTAVIDGTGTTKGRGIALSTGHSVYLSDIKIQNFSDGGIGLSAAGGFVGLSNLHFFNNFYSINPRDYQKISFFSALKRHGASVPTACLIDGNDIPDSIGIFMVFHCHIQASFQGNDFANVLKIQNCDIGILGKESSLGHVNKIWIDSCNIGFSGQGQVRYNTDRARVWRCGIGLDRMYGCMIVDNDIDFGEGTANACTRKFRDNGGAELYRLMDTLQLYKVNGISTDINIAYDHLSDDEAHNCAITYNSVGTTETAFWRPLKIKSGDVAAIWASTIAGIDNKTVHQLVNELGIVVSPAGSAQTQDVIIRMYLGDIASSNLVAFAVLDPGATGTATKFDFKTHIVSPISTKSWAQCARKAAVLSDYQENTTLDLRNGSDIPLIFTLQFAAADPGVILSVRTGECWSTTGRCPY